MDDDWLDELPELADAGGDHSRDATVIGYISAYENARQIVDAAKHSMRSGYWAARDVPAERGPIIEAITRRMDVAARSIPPAIVGVAVDDVLAGRPPRW